MKQVFSVCVFAVLCVLQFSCVHNKEVEHIVSNAEQLLNTNPDSSLFILDNIREDKPTWSRSQQMRYELVYAQAQNKAFVNFTTDSIALELVDYYERHGNANEQMMANYILGCAYRDLGSAPKALEAYRDAVESADTTDMECDFRQLMLIHSQMAYLYQIIQIPEAEEQEIERAILLASRIQDYNSVNIFKELKCNLLLKKNNFQGCICLSDSLYQTYIQQGNYYEASRVCVSSAKAYIALAEYDSAKIYLDRYSNIFKTDVSIRTIRGGKDAYNILKGRHYLGIEKVDSALVCFNNVNIRELEASIKVNVYKDISDAYDIAQKRDSAYKYLALHSKLSNELYDRAVAEASVNAKHLYDYTKVQEQALKAEQKALHLRITMILLVVIVIALAIVAWSIHWKRLKVERQKQIDTNKEYQLLLHELEKSAEELLLVKTDSERFLKEKESEIHSLQKSLSLYQGNSLNLEQWEDEREFLSCDLVNHFHDMSSRTQTATATELDKLFDIAQKAFPKLYSTVTDSSHGLSHTEIIICVLIRFRFIPSEISILLGHSSQRITNLKSSINQKLFGTSGAKTLDAHLIALK